MPAVSKKQQKFFGIVRAIQKGEMAPTTPETAKAAADMKKGDVKKFASTKHKGLPEKKKIVEDKQVKKIIKQLRKSVKSHKKQADTLEKKIKTFKESAFTNITVGNKVAQTFQHATGATITVDGALGGKMMVPSQVTLDLGFGEKITVDGPTESEFGLAGYTKPLDSKLQKRIADQSVFDINSRLLASEKASGAPTARITSIRQSGFGGGQGNKTNRRGSAFNKDGSVNLGSNAEMTYEEDVVNAINAITNKYNNKIQPIYKKLDAIPRNNNRYAPPSPAEIKLLNQIDSLIDAQTKEEQGVYDEWDEYNKQPNPDLNLPQDVPQYQQNRNKQNQIRQDYQRITNYGDHDLDVSDYNLDDNDMFDQKADEFGVSTSKDMFDFYMDKFVDNPTNKSVNMNRIFKPHLNTIKGYLPDIEKLIKLGQIQGDSTEKIQKDINDYWDGTISANMPTDLRNSLGNGSQLDVKQYLKTGNWQINKSFVFTEPSDFQGRGLGGLKKFGPQVYAVGKSIQKGTRGDLRPYVNVPMNYNITISGSEAKTSGPEGTFDADMNYIPPGYEDAIRTNEIGKVTDPTIKIGKVGKGVYDLSKTYNNTGSPNITDWNYASKLMDKAINATDYSAGNEGSRSEAQARSGYEKVKKGLSGFPSWSDLSSDLKLPDTPKPPSIPPSIDPKNFDDDGNFTPPNEPGWTYDEYMKQYAALQDAAARMGDPIEKEIMRYGPTGYKGVFKNFIDRFGQRNTPIGLIDAREAITNALTRALGALSDRWEAYNKAFQPPTGGGSAPSPDPKGRMKGGQGGRRLGSTTQRQGGAYNPGNPYGTGLDRSDSSFKKSRKQKGMKESKLSFELIQQFKEGSNPDRPKKLKEQTTFPQMQERIRNAKEKRREQQKKSEKLYMDTKKKGVKFYDKKGTGRLKDGKKVYD